MAVTVKSLGGFLGDFMGDLICDLIGTGDLDSNFSPSIETSEFEWEELGGSSLEVSVS